MRAAADVCFSRYARCSSFAWIFSWSRLGRRGRERVDTRAPFAKRPVSACGPKEALFDSSRTVGGTQSLAADGRRPTRSPQNNARARRSQTETVKRDRSNVVREVDVERPRHANHGQLEQH